MENVVVHIISHSHWDREWYLPFESHRMQLVELFDKSKRSQRAPHDSSK